MCSLWDPHSGCAGWEGTAHLVATGIPSCLVKQAFPGVLKENTSGCSETFSVQHVSRSLWIGSMRWEPPGTLLSPSNR